jgi:hypothetical protein
VDYVSRPWLAVVPWTQVRLSSGAIATVLPHWPLYQRRLMLPGRAPVVFTPEPMAFAEVCEPDDQEALATLAAAFGPLEVVAEYGATADWWRCPAVDERSVYAHLRDVHRTLDRGTTSHLTSSVNDALRYHWQVHHQLLVHPLPLKHFHDQGVTR